MESQQTLNPLVDPAELDKVRAVVGDILVQAQNFPVINSVEERAAAARIGGDAKRRADDAKAQADKVIKPIEAGLKQFKLMRDSVLKPAEQAMDVLRAKIGDWDVREQRRRDLERQEQERIQREAQAKYERERREWEAQEKARQEAADKAQREQQEAEARAKAEQDLKIKEEEDARLALAKEAQAKGNVESIDVILDRKTAVAPSAPVPVAPAPVQAILPPPPPPPPAPVIPVELAAPASDGAISRDIWKHEVSDPMAFLQAIVDGKIALYHEKKNRKTGLMEKVPIIEANTAVIGPLVRKLKDRFNCPGIRTWVEKSTAFNTVEEDA